MQPILPAPTPTWHNDSYPEISPTRPELSVSGKKIVITGATSPILRETALAFATAGATSIALIARTEAALKESAAALPDTVEATTFAVDLADETTMRQAASSIGSWDILVLGAAHVASPSPVSTASPEDFWKAFETNVKGAFVAIQALLPNANKSEAVILGLTTGLTALPAALTPGLSGYMCSKLAQTRLLEYVAAENPTVFVASVHPGMVDSDGLRRSGARAEDLPIDKVQLPAHFLVWMSSPEARFLKGRAVWANWDVQELKAKAEELQKGMSMTAGINGWPYPFTG